MTDCIFCNKKENIVFNTNNFYVKIGKGIICEGHCMIIPNKHCTCIADGCIDFIDEFLLLKEKLIQFLSDNFYKPFIVEYGAVMQSVFHGHMHFIPLRGKEYDKLSLIDEMVLPFIQNNNVVCEKINSFNKLIDIFNKDKEYLYFEESGKTYIVRTKHNQNIIDDMEIQLNYRDFFANKIGLDGVKNWKLMTEEDIIKDNIKVERTREIFKNFADFYYGK